MTTPLVSCIMPTRNRARFIPQALRCFAHQTYPNRELIVVDDSDRPMRRLVDGVEGVRYLRVRRSTTGAKLNIGIEAAQGDILQRMDDDDFYACQFLQSSVEHLLHKDPARALVTRCCFLTLVRSDEILRQAKHGWTPGGAFCFFRELWKRKPFRDTPTSEDSYFLRDHEPDVFRICDPEQYTVVRHGRNTWTAIRLKQSHQVIHTDEYFRQLPAYHKDVAEVLGAESESFYRRVLRWPRE